MTKRKTTRPKSSGGANELVALRLPRELLERIDGYAERLREETPGMRATRTDAIRILVSKALAFEDKRTG